MVQEMTLTSAQGRRYPDADLDGGRAGQLLGRIPGPHRSNVIRPNDSLSQFAVRDCAAVLSAVASQTCLTPRTNCLLCCARYGCLIRATGLCSIRHSTPTPRSRESKSVPELAKGLSLSESQGKACVWSKRNLSFYGHNSRRLFS